MKIGDRIFVRGYIDEIRKDTVIVRNDGGYFGTILSEVTGELPSAQPEIIRCKDCKHWTNNIGDSKLKDNYCNDEAHGFYYQCSEDDYCSFAERRTDEQTVS